MIHCGLKIAHWWKSITSNPSLAKYPFIKLLRKISGWTHFADIIIKFWQRNQRPFSITWWNHGVVFRFFVDEIKLVLNKISHWVLLTCLLLSVVFDDDVISSTGHRESILLIILSPINSDQTIYGGIADGLSGQCEQRRSGCTRRTQTVHQQQVVRVCVLFSPQQPQYNSRCKWRARPGRPSSIGTCHSPGSQAQAVACHTSSWSY